MCRPIFSSLFASLLIAFTELPAQLRRGDPGFKDPTTALVLEIVVPGGGHLYSGETAKGVLLLGGSVGAATAGFLTTWASRDHCESTFMMMQGNDCTANHFNWTPLAIGAAVAVGLRIYGLASAPGAAERANARAARAIRTLPVRPLISVPSAGETRLGFEIPFAPRLF
ncbi:MAG: hypothetical protein ACREOG_17525 [Gemmatimonadaceae bacterium]